jgi:amidase/aspartyl-tRNA(Asn)/glutamyl-tRNA(Gln) amidotransferase subunit A
MAVMLRALLGLHEDSKALRGAWLELPGADEGVAAAQRAAAARFAAPLEEPQAGRLRDVFEDSPDAFSTLRGPEVWTVHEAWAESMASRYSPAIYERLTVGRKSTPATEIVAKAVNARLQALLSSLWAEYDFLVLPATPCVAPSAAGCTQAVRDRILRFTTPMSLAGLPVLSIPVALPGGLSTGLQIVAPRLDSPAFLQVLKTLR